MSYKIGDIVCWKENMETIYGVIVGHQTIVKKNTNGRAVPEPAYVIEDDMKLIHVKKEKELLTIH